MLNQKQFFALLGFAFVAAWVAFAFGYALLCLLGAGLFYGAAAVVEGDVDLGELQSRVRGGSAPDPLTPPPVAPPRRAPRVR